MNKPDVHISPLGYQYKILNTGTGTVSPSKNSTVLVNYELRSLNGIKLDSSYDRGTPIRFKLSEVILGWKYALSEMVEGEKRTIYIPAELAYGCNAQPPRIGFDEALVFDVELIKIL